MANISNVENRTALHSGVWYTASSFLAKGIVFITTPIFTRLMTKAEFGLFNNFVSVLSILTILVTLNLESTLISARYDFKDKFDEYILSTLSLSSISVVSWFVLIRVFTDFFQDLLGVEAVYLSAMMVYLLALPAINLFQARERYLFEYKKTVAVSISISISTALLSVALVLLMTDKLAGRTIGFIIPTVVIGIILYLYLIKKGKRIDVTYWKYAIPICLPFIPHLLSLVVLNSIDRMMITRICGAESTALYSVGYSVGMIITLFLTSLNSAFAPWLGNKLANNSFSEIRRVSRVYVTAFLYISVGAMLAAPEILYIMGGKQYMETVSVIPPIAMGCACQFVYTMFVNVEQFKKKTAGMAIASVTAAAINYGLNFWFIPLYGYVAAAYTTLLGYVWLVASHMFLVYKLGYKDVYDYRFTSFSLFVMGLLTLGVSLLYEHTVIRYTFIVVYIVSMIAIGHWKKKAIIGFMGKRF